MGALRLAIPWRNCAVCKRWSQNGALFRYFLAILELFHLCGTLEM